MDAPDLARPVDEPHLTDAAGAASDDGSPVVSQGSSGGERPVAAVARNAAPLSREHLAMARALNAVKSRNNAAGGALLDALGQLTYGAGAIGDDRFLAAFIDRAERNIAAARDLIATARKLFAEMPRAASSTGEGR